MLYHSTKNHACSLTIYYLNHLNNKVKHNVVDLTLTLGENKAITEGPDGESLDLNFNLDTIEFKRKLYRPGEIIADIIIHAPSDKEGNYLFTNCKVQVLRKLFLRKPVKLSITGSRYVTQTNAKGTTETKSSDFNIEATNYFVHEIIPIYKSNSNGTSVELKLLIYSLDKLMTLDKYSQAYLGRKFRAEIAKSSNRFNLGLQYYPQDSTTINIDDTYKVSLNDETLEITTKTHKKKVEKVKLQHLANGKSYKVNSNKGFKFDDNFYIEVENEFIQPYLVQYNESFYDFLVRIANRCGEFLYFEDGKLNIGLQLNPVDEIDLKLDNSTTKNMRAIPKSSVTSTELKGYEELYFHNISSGVLSVEDYARDSLKDKVSTLDSSDRLNHNQIGKDENKIIKETKKGEDGSTTEVEKEITVKHSFPIDTNIGDKDSSHYYYNSEIAHDEFFMPLYKDGFAGDGKGKMVLFEELFYGNRGAIFFHYMSFLMKVVSLFDFACKFVAEGIDLGIEAARTFYEKNQKGNEKFIEKYSPTYRANPGNGENPRKFEKMPPYVVPYSEGNISRWTTLEYYSDIKRFQDEMEREMVTIKLGSNFSDVKIGQIITLEATGDSTFYVICENNISLTSRMEQILTAIPLKQLNNSNNQAYFIAYPPAIKGSVFRTSGPQTAFVIESKDPKRQGRLRIKYPWQTNAKVVEFEDLNYASSEEKEAVEAYNKIRTEAATPWIRMSTPSATNGGGFYFKPEKGDEVLVNFENGNVERPYVIGALYSKNTTAPSHIGSRVIVSKYGHKIKFKDPSDAGWQRIMGNISPIFDFINFLGGEEMPDWKGDVKGMEKLSGGIDISDAYGLYKISMSSDSRSIKIDSPLGNIDLNAFTGIKISAPNGNIKIEGKNIELKASNKVTISSGKNLEKNFIKAGLKDKASQNLETLARKVYKESPIDLNLIDMDLLRNVFEVFLRPVNGTLSLKTSGFLTLEAGKGNAEIPYTEYSQKYYNQFFDHKSSRNIEYEPLFAMLTAVANSIVAAVDEYKNQVTAKVNSARVPFKDFKDEYVIKDFFTWNTVDKYTETLFNTPKKIFTENDIKDDKKQQLQNEGQDLSAGILPVLNQKFSALWDMINGDEGLAKFVDRINILSTKVNETLTNAGILSNSDVARKVRDIIDSALRNHILLFDETVKLKSNNANSQAILDQDNPLPWDGVTLNLKRQLIVDFINQLPNLNPLYKVNAKTIFQSANGVNWNKYLKDLEISVDLTDESQKFKLNPFADAFLDESGQYEDFVADHQIWNNANQLTGKILLSEDKTHTWSFQDKSLRYKANHDQSLEDAMNEKLKRLKTHLYAIK